MSRSLGSTVNDFSKGLVYQVVGHRAASTSYTVTIKHPDDDQAFGLKSFALKKNLNPHVFGDVQFILEENRVYTTLPKMRNMRFSPVFEVNGGKLFVGDAEQKSGESVVDFATPITYTLISEEGFKRYYTVYLESAKDIPHIYINTENGQAITSKENYILADFQIDGGGTFADISNAGRIRGRGNSTWGMPKKPYRINFDQSTSVFGLGAARNWVLLANHLDYTSLLSATAFRLGQLLEAPFTNTVVPVELTLNGRYQGLYLFTEHVQVNEHRVNVGDDGFLLELDSYFDEDYKFRSKHYNLPVNIKYPDLNSNAELPPIREEFEEMESLIFANTFPDKGYRDLFNINAFAKWFVINHFTYNREINHPKSTYIHKEINGKYTFGPIWDFDWGFGFDGVQYYFRTREVDLLRNNPAETGSPLFRRLIQDPEIKKTYERDLAIL